MSSQIDVVFIVHGSNVRSRILQFVAGKCLWWSKNSPFCREIYRAFGAGGCEIRIRRWNGKNRHQERVHAGKALAEAIKHVEAHRRVHIVGHSHGGNAALIAANLVPPGRISSIVLLANPNMASLSSTSRPCDVREEQGSADVKGCGGEQCHWYYWGNAPVRVERIWNLYSPQDQVQALMSRMFHGIPARWSQPTGPRLIVLPNYEGPFAHTVESKRILWSRQFADFLERPLQSRGLDAHTGMHSQEMGRVVGRLLNGDEFESAMRSANLHLDEPNDVRNGGGDLSVGLRMRMEDTISPDPYQFSPSEKQVGILLVHGFAASATETFPLAEFLNNAAKWRCDGILLPGHGTTVEDMETTGSGEWLKAVEEAYTRLARDCQSVFLVGLSMGAALCTIVAADHAKDDRLGGVILLSPAFGLDWYSSLAVRVVGKFQRFRYKGDDAVGYFLKNNIFSYTHLPLRRVPEMEALGSQALARLDELKQKPIRLMAGLKEDTVSLKKMLAVEKGREGWIKPITLSRSRHIVTIEPDKQMVFERTLDFIKSIVNPEQPK